MSLFDANESCAGCINAVWCTECESFKYCSVGKRHSGMDGSCSSYEGSPQNIKEEKQASAQPTQLAIPARAVVNHWDEFGPENGFDETVECLRRALKLQAGA